MDVRLRLVLLPVCWTGSSGVSMISITDIASTGAAGVASSFKRRLNYNQPLKRGDLKEDFPRLKADPVSALLIRTIELLLQVWGVCVPRKPGQAAATTTFPAQMLLQKVANGNNFKSDSRSFLYSKYLIRINRIDSILL